MAELARIDTVNVVPDNPVLPGQHLQFQDLCDAQIRSRNRKGSQLTWAIVTKHSFDEVVPLVEQLPAFHVPICYNHAIELAWFLDLDYT